MNAEQARKLCEQSTSGPSIAPFIGYINTKIEAAAKRGERSIQDPLSGIRSVAPSPAAANAIWLDFRSRGFAVTHHPDPDHGHPCSRPYTEISW